MKCKRCKKRAEFRLPDDKKVGFCEDHAIAYLKKSRENFLPRITRIR